MIVGDHGRMAGMGRVDERGNPALLSVVTQDHGPQIEAHLVWGREDRSQIVMNFDLFLDEFEIPRKEVGTLFEIDAAITIGQCRNAQERQIFGFCHLLFRFRCFNED